MADTEKFKKRIRAGRVPGVAGPPRGMPKGSVAGDIIGAPRKRQLMQKTTRVEEDPYSRARIPTFGTSNPLKYHRYGSKSVDDEDTLKPVAGLYHTFKYDQPRDKRNSKPKPSGKRPSKKGDKPLYGYRGTDNPVAKKKKTKKKIPKTKKRIKGTLRDNLPIFGGQGRVPEG